MKIDQQNPFLGLGSFDQTTSAYFFGRDEEIETLVSKIRASPLTVLYGQSGLGKTSLLGAGVLPELQLKEYELSENSAPAFAPALLRLRYSEGSPSIIEQTRNALIALLPPAKRAAAEECETLWEIFHKLPLAIEPGDPIPVLLFDQFEEIFTLGDRDGLSQNTEEWFTQVADLIEGRAPLSLEEAFSKDHTLAEKYITPGTIPCRLLISLRDDYLSYLEPYRQVMPKLNGNRMGLRKLRGTQALEAVLGPASLGEKNLIHPRTASQLVRIVAGADEKVPLAEVEAVPPILSLVCQELNQTRINEGKETIEIDSVAAESDKILSRFYEKSFEELDESIRARVRTQLEESLLTKSGFRKSEVREDFIEELLTQGVSREAAQRALKVLEDRRLIVPDTRSSHPRIEFSHDVLAPLIRASRDERQERERLEIERAEREKAEEKLRQAKLAAMAERKKRRRLTALLIGATICLVAAIFAGLIARQKTRIAESAEKDAIASEKQANVAREDAEVARARVSDLLQGAAHSTFERATLDLANQQPATGLSLLARAIQQADTTQHIASQRRLFSELGSPVHPVQIHRFAGEIEMANFRRDGLGAVVTLEGGKTYYQSLAPDLERSLSRIEGVTRIFPMSGTDHIAVLHDAGANRNGVTEEQLSLIPIPRDLPAPGTEQRSAWKDPIKLLSTASTARSVHFTADGSTVALLDRGNSLHLVTFRDIYKRTGESRNTFEAHFDQPVRQVHLMENNLLVLFGHDANGQSLARYSIDWYGETLEELWKIDITAPPEAGGFIANGVQAFDVSRDQRHLLLHDTGGLAHFVENANPKDSPTLTGTVEIPKNTTRIAFAHDEELAWGISGGESPRLFQILPSDQESGWELRLSSSLASDAEIISEKSPDSMTIATGSADGTLQVTRATDGQVLHQFSAMGSIRSLAYTPTGDKLMVTTTGGTLAIYDLTLSRKSWQTLTIDEADLSTIGSTHAAFVKGRSLQLIDRITGEGRTVTLPSRLRKPEQMAIDESTSSLFISSLDRLYQLPLGNPDSIEQVDFGAVSIQKIYGIVPSASGAQVFCKVLPQRYLYHDLNSGENRLVDLESIPSVVEASAESGQFTACFLDPEDDQVLRVERIGESENIPLFQSGLDAKPRLIHLLPDESGVLVNDEESNLYVQPLDQQVATTSTDQTAPTLDSSSPEKSKLGDKKDSRIADSRIFLSRDLIFDRLLISRNSDVVAAILESGSVRVFTGLKSGKATKLKPLPFSGDTSAISLSNDGRYLVLPAVSSRVVIYDLEEAGEVESFALPSPATRTHLTPSHLLVEAGALHSFALSSSNPSFYADGDEGGSPSSVGAAIEAFSGLSSETSSSLIALSPREMSEASRDTTALLRASKAKDSTESKTTLAAVDMSETFTDFQERVQWRLTPVTQRKTSDQSVYLHAMAREAYLVITEDKRESVPALWAVARQYPWYPAAPAIELAAKMNGSEFGEVQREAIIAEMTRRYLLISIDEWGHENFEQDVQIAVRLLERARMGHEANEFRQTMEERL